MPSLTQFKKINIPKCHKIILIPGMVAGIWLLIFIIVPKNIFNTPYSSLLYSRDGKLMGARIAPDGQWRFPMGDSLPKKYIRCLTTYEDKRFFYHPGIDPAAILRAIKTNFNAGHVVSGGSTITMQLVRLARGNQERTLLQKLCEAGWAVMLEATRSKKSILNLYAAHAPFGGNVIGLESAAWRYFGRSAADLSWAECATLAVLPNAPALIHPGRNRQQLLEKRNQLLAKLNKKGVIDNHTYELSCMEPLPEAPLPLPDLAPHLLERLSAQTPGERINTSLNSALQLQATQLVNQYALDYAANHIYNLAALIADVETGEVLAYVGNTTIHTDPARGGQVDIITSPRSTGSILKPLLYAGMLHDGEILPNTLVADTPLNINGFTPQNFNRTYYGAVPARAAIERSLNVPLVRMLSSYHTGRFLALLKSVGMTTLPYREDHYGASLILGGAEGTLWDIAGIYGSMSRVLSHHRKFNGRYYANDFRPLTPLVTKDQEPKDAFDTRLSSESLLSRGALWYTVEAMSGVSRPEEEADWQQFASMKRIAWKTGTSWGGRDGWAVGFTPRYVVGIWVGNASGEGRSGLTGVGNAAPVLFDLFSLLEGGGWFDMPHDDLESLPICRESGHKSSALCLHVDTLEVPRKGIETPLCPYHKLIHLSTNGLYRVNASCESIDRMITRSWFILPPSQEYYYRNYHIDYQTLPPFKAGCEPSQDRQIDIIYPEHGAVLFLPRGFSGEQKFIFKAAHTQQGATLFWYLDETYLGESSGDHQMACSAKKGLHTVTLTDHEGNQRKISFEVK